jgi:hypothetical protein|tara:strand:+ start:6096 stop:6239 length:144 start_codon:yes stop_codon:yes gene_type:complete
MSDVSNDKLERTTEIEQGEAEIGSFVKGVIAVITLVCVAYLVLNINP